MSAFYEFLKFGSPDAPDDLLRKVADEFATSLSCDAEAAEENGRLRKEIGRLNGELVAHRNGIQNASMAGLDVLGERARQRRYEGYDDAHDDEHDDGSLLRAAICYAEDALLRLTTGHGFDDTPPPSWPWEAVDWRPKDTRRMMVNAAALLISEIEVGDRARERASGQKRGA